MFNLYFFELWQFSNGSSWTVHGEEDMGMGRLIWGLIQSWTAPHVHCILVFLMYFLILFSKGRRKYMTSAWWHADITLLEQSRARAPLSRCSPLHACTNVKVVQGLAQRAWPDRSAWCLSPYQRWYAWHPWASPGASTRPWPLLSIPARLGDRCPRWRWTDVPR
jgi:hypothetical protein